MNSVPSILRQRSRFWHFNAHAVLSGNEAAVVDPGIFPDEIQQFREEILSRGARITTVILTHSHHDHIRGWASFPGAKIVSTRKAATKDETARSRILAAKEAIDRKYGVEDPGFHYPKPEIVFDRDLSWKVGSTEILLRELPGHSDCIAAAIVPELRSLFSGDYLVSPGMPYCRWRVDRFREALGKLRNWVGEFGIETVYPAHNDPISGQKEILAAIEKEEGYFSSLEMIVKELAAENRSEEEIAKETARRIRPGKLWEQDRDNAKRLLREIRLG